MAGDTIGEAHTRLPLPGQNIGVRFVSTCWRIVRLWRMYAALDLAFLVADAKLACIYLSSDAILSIASITGMLLLAERFAGIGAWSQQQVIFLLGYATLVDGIVNTFFGYNVLRISRRIGRGQLDHTLVQPQSLAIALLTEGFTPFSGSAMLFPGIALLWWSMSALHVAVTIPWLAAMALNVVASILVVVSFSFIWGSLAFWAPRAAEEVSSSATSLLEQLKSFPFDGLRPLLLGAFTTVVPVGFVAWYPSRALLGLDNSSPWLIWVTPIAALVLGCIAFLCFRKGLEHYGRTGSQRYSNLGHRS